MHKRNITITALVWAAIITLAFLCFPRLYHGIIGWLYFPTIVLAVAISHFFGGNPHSPSNTVGWSSFAVYTIFYWIVFLIVYVILLEIYLLRRVLRHLEDAKQILASDKPDSKKSLERIGQAIAELEARRRKHFLLKKLDLPDLPKSQYHLLAAHAIAKEGKSRPVKALLKKLQSKVAAQTNPQRAAILLARLKEDANTLVSQPPDTGEKDKTSGSGTS